MKTPTLEQKVAEFLMSHGCLKMRDAIKCARLLVKMIARSERRKGRIDGLSEAAKMAKRKPFYLTQLLLGKSKTLEKGTK